MSSVVTSAQQWLAAVSLRRQLCKQLLLTSLQPIAAVMYGRECWSPILTSTTGLSTAGGPGAGAVKLTLMLVSVTGAAAAGAAGGGQAGGAADTEETSTNIADTAVPAGSFTAAAPGLLSFLLALLNFFFTVSFNKHSLFQLLWASIIDLAFFSPAVRSVGMLVPLKMISLCSSLLLSCNFESMSWKNLASALDGFILALSSFHNLVASLIVLRVEWNSGPSRGTVRSRWRTIS